MELVESLSTDAFLHAIRRFASNHGWPKTIISDNGRNFVGAERDLRTMFEKDRKELTDFATSHRIEIYHPIESSSRRN